MQKGIVQLSKEHAAYLDKKFHKSYPNGQFALQRMKPIYGYFTITDYRIHWSPHRSTRNSFVGITVCCLGGEIVPCDEHKTSLGKWTYYKDIDTMLAAAGRFGCPQELIDTFMEKHKNWKE